MTQTDRWEQIRELFEEVARHVPNERREALQKLSPTDIDLQNEVLSLLEHDERAEPRFLTPLERPLTEMESDGPDPLIGTRLVKCIIRRVIAAGGMGVVYEAEQENPRRIVAIKVMKSLAWSRMARRRFEFEVQALARLAHPNIAQIYDADTVRIPGVAEGTPYFVMEFIPDASPITEYADRHKLDRKGRLDLFLQACEAVKYGHQRGIIHRDLKPANILVGTAGQAKVIDFGVARATDSDVAATTQITDVGQLIGTLRYMSPEQCKADPLGLDVRSDVYALGVVLYELLCGRPPYAVSATSITQAARAICEEPPARPSVADRSLRGDLEIILLKALQKDREKRYQSIADLSRDVRHFLNREPIEARRPSFAAPVGHWMRRHPVWTTTAAAMSVVACLFGAFIISLWLYGFRPYRAIIQNEGREVTLVSAAGRVLYTWKGQDAGTFAIAELLEAKGRRLILIGEAFWSGTPSSGTLRAFDADARDYEIAVGTDRIEANDIPDLEPERKFLPGDFGPGIFSGPIDVFPEVPGPEFITSFSHIFSRRCLRICSLDDGKVLWQSWYDGNISSVLWLKKPGLLVGAGTNEEVPWPERGGPTSNKADFIVGPRVVWAIHPVAGERTNRYICTGRSQEIQTPEKFIAPAWHKCLLPASSTYVFSNHRVERPLQASLDDGAHFTLLCTYDLPGALHAGWTMDENGEPSGPNPFRTSAYLDNLKELRAKDWLIDNFHLGDLPPIRFESQIR